MNRVHVVTGSASGIGAATRSLLEAGGDRVIGVDLREAEVIADLSTEEGRRSMADGVRSASGGRIDSIVVCAGLGSESELTARVNYFGAVATLERLRPLLEQSPAPRALTISSVVIAYPVDEELVLALHAGDEAPPSRLRQATSSAGGTWSTLRPRRRLRSGSGCTPSTTSGPGGGSRSAPWRRPSPSLR